MLTMNWRRIYFITRIIKDKLHELIRYLFLKSWYYTVLYYTLLNTT